MAGAGGARPEDHRLAADLAEGAGRLLLDIRADLIERGADPVELRAEGDRRSHDWLMSELARRAPGDAVLSEEGADDDARLGAERVWIVDPLDGTREFGEPPRGDWAVHVALVVGGDPVAGAVALPAQRLTLATDPPAPPPREPSHRPRILVSRTRPPALAAALAEALDGELVAMGSAGAKVGAVVLGAAEVYAHAGGQYEWDSCAPVAVARAAGFHASRIDGSPLRYNNADPSLPDLLVCHPGLAERVAAVLADLAQRGGLG
ncbi:MAG: 3'(2'),5'-bisphosphate nucleotidase CysQ [Actinobacteria bacterium]|nr:3'(2'),5'-bisphosphate nucleotidase CysQ [Actinomycetota bacterium]